MSGFFDIIEKIEEYLYGKDLDKSEMEWFENAYLKSHISEDDWNYIKEQKKIKPNIYKFSDETLNELFLCIDILKQANIYTNRIEHLLTGDENEETFHKQLEKDLQQIL